jgi:hypothetical protein
LTLSLALSKQPDLNPQQIAKRSGFVVNDVHGADFFRIKTSPESRGRVFSLVNVTDFRTLATPGGTNAQRNRVEAKTL